MPRLRYSSKFKEDLKQIVRYGAEDYPIAARKWRAAISRSTYLASYVNFPASERIHRDLAGNPGSRYAFAFIRSRSATCNADR